MVSLPPLWKIRREAAKIPNQTKKIGALAVSRSRKARHDREKWEQISLREGGIAPSRKVAIFLIFQPGKVLESTLFTLKHLTSNGYAPLLVSNCPLSFEDHARLGPLCWKIMQRPNIGYDFGGYRDGIEYLKGENNFPDCLLVLNDSIWFPTREDTDILEQMESRKSDVVGMALNRSNRPHIQSFFFLFKGIISDPAFLDYWEKLPLYDHKRLVVKRCEIGMTGALENLGYSTECIFEIEQAWNVVRSMDRSSLLEFISYMKTAEIGKRQEIGSLEKLVRSDQDWSQELNICIERGVFGSYLPTLDPRLLFETLGFPALKKVKEHKYEVQRRYFLEANISNRLDKSVLREIQNWS